MSAVDDIIAELQDKIADLERQLKDKLIHCSSDGASFNAEAVDEIRRLLRIANQHIEKQKESIESLQQQLQEANERIKLLEAYNGTHTRLADTPLTIQAYKQLESELAQLRQENAELKDWEAVKSLLAERDTLRAEVERYKREEAEDWAILGGKPFHCVRGNPHEPRFGGHDCDYCVTADLRARVQELEKALKEIKQSRTDECGKWDKHDDTWQIAKRALERGNEV